MIRLCLITTLIVGVFAATPCTRRNYGSSFVCVCSESSCDTVDPVQVQPTGTYLLYTTNQENERFALTQGTFTPTSTPTQRPQINILWPWSTTTIKPNRDEKHQEIIGFGGAFTDATAINIRSLSDNLQSELLNAYFGTTGLEYNFGRVPIGGTDFSTVGYSYDDTANDEPDAQLAHFALTNEDLQHKIPLIKRALTINSGLELLASAWTAPKWMKTNGKYTAGAIKTEYYQTWADYFLRFFQEYKKEGLEFWGLTTGNEPSLAIVNSAINTVGWFPTDLRKWIGANLGPTIRNSEFAHLKILTLDDQRFFLPWYPSIVIKNEAAPYVDGIALHWYWDFIIPPIVLDWTHEAFPDALLLATESCRGDKAWEAAVSLGDWSRAEDYAHAILEDFNHHVAGWIDWNLALNMSGGPTYIGNEVDATIIVNAAEQEFYKQPMYYAMGHFSKFIPRGSLRLGYAASNGQVEVGAFERPDHGIVLVVHNRKDSVQMLVVEDVQGQIRVELTPKSINTFVYW